jgi:cysteinyl-tRNA synthetase
MNITNIDDKIIRKSQETGKSWKLLTEEYEAEFWEDLNKLNVRHPDIKLRVTDKIPEIIQFIEEIERKGFTTRADDGSVLFKTSDYSNYGKLHNIGTDDINKAKFALWKAAKENEPHWPSKWGNGRPGWHIECSTLATLMFGSYIDFHAGGIDLKFPHHENEEAQSCVYHNCKDWVGHWIHTGHLHMKGHNEKMSKSLKNTVSIQEMLQTYSSDQFRMACLLSHYRSSIEFGPELMQAADMVLKRLQSFNSDVKAFINGLKSDGFIDVEALSRQFEKCKTEVDEALKDDFHTAMCITHVSELIKTSTKMLNVSDPGEPKSSFDKALLHGIINYVDDLFKLFGVGDKRENSSNNQFDNLVNSIISARNQIRLKAKENKNKELFGVCDSLRDAMKENQIEIKDHGSLSSWNRIK